MAASSMNAVADKYAAQDIGSIFLYTNEAHPGEIYPHHTSFEQKLKQAADLISVYGVNRPILVDALGGACHRYYGGNPNMTWIFNRAGTIVYRSDWSNAQSVENTILYLLDVQARRRAGERMGPFRVERLDYRVQDSDQFYAGLEKNGPKAVDEFRVAFD